MNPRFVWIIGSIQEIYPDLPQEASADTVLWDRQEKLPVVTIHTAPGREFSYGQLFCLETTGGGASTSPFTALENWLNDMDPGDLESECIPGTKPEFDNVSGKELWLKAFGEQS